MLKRTDSMRRQRFLGSIIAALVLAMLSPGMAVTHAARHTAQAAQRLPTNPKSPAFRFGLRGGFSRLGSFTITIYADGHVRLTKEQRTSPIHLSHPKATIYPVALTGLLTLAKAEHFFAMPARIVPKHPVSDMGTSFVTVYTTTGRKTVSVVGNSSRPFYELYSLLNYAAGATS